METETPTKTFHITVSAVEFDDGSAVIRWWHDDRPDVVFVERRAL